MAQKEKSQEAALEQVSGRSKVGNETVFGKGKNARQWVGRGGSVGKCGWEILSDETPLEEE